MMYPFMTLNDDTEITHSETLPGGRVRVYIETPDERGGFRSATCWLPDYRWEGVCGYTASEMSFLKRLVRNNDHLTSMPCAYHAGFPVAISESMSAMG